MSLRYLHYDVFTDTPLTGNQLAVFPDGRGLTAELMQRIAREMAFSETTFVLPPDAAGTDAQMRIFTPLTEVPMAGHPTIGSTFALAREGVIRAGQEAFVFSLGIGPVRVEMEWDGDSLKVAWMTQLLPDFGTPVEGRNAVLRELGLEASDGHSTLPLQRVSCGLAFLLVPLASSSAVDGSFADAGAVARIAEVVGEHLPIYVFSAEGEGTGVSTYSRMFAPQFGIAEDPATGGASGPLGSYIAHHGVLQGAARYELTNVQGVAMGRPSRIGVRIEAQGREITRVQVGGHAVFVGEGALELP